MSWRSFHRRRYERPHEHWLCGRAREGRPCPKGPTRGGNCGGAFECTPARVGDRWVCTRPTEFGGPCDDPSLPAPDPGPVPVAHADAAARCCRPTGCVPELSLRAKRGMAVKYGLAITLGILLIGVGSSSLRERVISPGPLTVHHQGGSHAATDVRVFDASDNGNPGNAQIPGDAVNCDSCHIALGPNARAGITGLLSAAVESNSTTRAAPLHQNQQCVVCHQEPGVSESFGAHGLPGNVIAKFSAKYMEGDAPRGGAMLALASLMRETFSRTDEILACAACHQEHRGRLFDLTAMDDRQCQVCHAQQFSRFERDHPEFAHPDRGDSYAYPYARRTRIVYDHWTHQEIHFPESDAAFDCITCHQPASQGQDMALATFEAMCAACHLDKDVLSQPPLDFLGVGLSREAWQMLDDEGLSNGFAKSDERALSPFVLVFAEGASELAGADGADASDRFGEDVTLIASDDYTGDISGLIIDYFDDDLPEGVEWDGPEALLSHLREVVAPTNPDNDAESPWAARLQRLAGDQRLTTDEVQAMLGPFASAPSFDGALEDLARRNPLENGGWAARRSGHTIGEAEWRALIAAQPAYATLVSEDEGSSLAAWFADFTAFQQWLEQNVLMTGRGWIYREGVQGAGSALEAEGWRDLVLQLAGLQEALDGGGAAAAFVEWLANLDEFRVWFDEHVDPTGPAWVLAAPAFATRGPTSHADRFFVEWLNFAGRHYSERASARVLFDSLTKSLTASCIKCHSVDAAPDLHGGWTARSIGWTSGSHSRGFTRFDHAPHLKLSRGASSGPMFDCASCHQPVVDLGRLNRLSSQAARLSEALTGAKESDPNWSALQAQYRTTDADRKALLDQKGAYLAAFRERESDTVRVDFTRPASNFGGITRDLCARCHTRQSAGNTCLTCHNYHVDGASDDIISRLYFGAAAAAEDAVVSTLEQAVH